ncbi:hypothetical protein VaNZ11_016917 [Volvox africanus]|uniref:Uncharacterized protein n=1 Tax=Volvox africanus TaxID=51714 RepID=A0ABQ5SNQ9_9CHLO|nr:hypothetical protein VaNZ11_016917 [Volvox africanus]
MGCGTSKDVGKSAQAPVSTDAKPKAGAPAAAPAAPAAAAPAADAAPVPPAPKDGKTEWHLLQYVDDLSKVTQGAPIPGFFLTVHDNKKEGLPRLGVLNVANGSITAVRIKDKARGLAEAKDLECLFMVDGAVAGKKQALYVAMTSKGKAFLFRVSMKKKKWVAHGIKAFEVHPPPGENTKHTNCEGARAYLENGQLWMEYGSRGGLTEDRKERITPWIARVPLDIKAIRKGTFKVDPAKLDVTYWPETLDNDPHVRQCADMGQAVGMARYGQLFAAAKDDEEKETHFMSYIMERLPGAQTGGVENFKPLYRVQGAKIEAIFDITKDVSIFATDDEGKGAFLTILHRHSGLAWKHAVVPPEGHDLRWYGVSGISPVDPGIRKKHDDSSSESDKSSSDEEEEKEEEKEEAQEEAREALEEAQEKLEEAQEALEEAQEKLEEAQEALEEAQEARNDE